MTAEKEVYRSEPDYAVSPGALLARHLRQRRLTQSWLAKKLETTPQALRLLLRGKSAMTAETAIGLERVLGVPAYFWQKAENTYRIRLRKREERLGNYAKILKQKPVRELVERKLISFGDSPETGVENVLKFFRQSSVEKLFELWKNPICSLRRSASVKGDGVALATWLQIGLNEADLTDCAPYDEKTFKETLKAIRAATVEDAKTFVPKTRDLCAQSGVALVFVPELENAAVNGAARWISSEKAAILVCLRGKKLDAFWFSFFHEAAHVLYGRKRENYVDFHTNAPDDPEELEADRFAGQFLIPARYDALLPSLKSKVEIDKFAKKIGVHPGIVVGRLQHDGLIPFDRMNGLKADADWRDFERAV